MSRKTLSRKTALVSAVALAAVLMAFAGPARSQTNEYTTVRGALERTEEVIAQARGIIEESRSNIARIALERAIALQAKASDLLTETRTQFAYKYTMEARQEAWHAVALARQEARIEDRLVSISENTRERLARLRERVVDSGIRDEQLERMMYESREQLEKARTHAQQLKNQLAVNFAENAARLSRQAENRFRGLLSDRDMVQRRLVILEELALRARERYSSGGQGVDAGMLEKAERDLSRAREMIGEGRYDAARITMERCERLLRGVARDIGMRADTDVERMAEETTRLMERAREMISSSGKDAAGVMARYEEAERLMAQARDMIGEGRGEEARAVLRRVRRMLRETVEMTGQGARAGAEQQIDELIRMRDEVREIAQSCKAQTARNLFARAEERLGSAMDHFEAGRMERARAEARIARNLFRRVREICVD